MINNFVVNVNNLTQGVTEQGFGLILVADNEHDIPYTILSDAAALIDIDGITVDSKVYKMVQKLFAGNPKPQEVAVFGDKLITDAAGLETELNGLINEQKADWFFVTSTMNDSATITKLSTWSIANEKLYFVTTQDLTLVEGIESPNTVIGYHENETDYFTEGLARNMAIALPGSITAMYETVPGSTPSNITLTELKKLHKDNGVSYIRNKGRNFVSEGKATDGSYIDVTMGSYFIKFRLEEALFLLAMNNGKIPYSDRGIGMLIAEVETVLKQATRQGIILEEDGKGVYTITALRRNEVLKNEIANRVYNGISVVATIAGAIHSSIVNIDLVLSEED